MANRSVTRQYGMPFDGFLASVKKWQARPGSLTGSSTNFQLSPFDGSIRRRDGMSLYGDVFGSSLGIMESKWTGYVRTLVELDSPSLADGYPTIGMLYTKEDYGSTATGADDGHFGQFWYRHTDNAVGSTAWRTLGSSFGAATYPTSAGSGFGTDHAFKCVPVWYDSGDGGYTRMTAAFQRRFACAGSRNVVDVGNWLHFPNLHASPVRWNKRGNKTTAVATEMERIFPWGLMPPLYPPSLATGSASTSSANRFWAGGDTFYYSVLFQFEDGSYSMPFLPRPASSIIAGGLGGFTVGTYASPNNYYQSVNWTNIPIGPEGTVARILLRTPKQLVTSTSEVLTVDPTDLRICGIIRNNTQTSWTDTLGDDTGLRADTNIVRTDHSWVRPSRYGFTLDQRVGTGYMHDMTSAIIIAPLSSSAGVDYAFNVLDTGPTGGWGTAPFILQNDGTTLRYGYVAGAPGTIAATSNAITLAGKTVQEVVDTINATTTASTGQRWVAAVVPGSDPNANATSLCQTTWAITGCVSTAGSLTVLTGGDFSAVPLGAYVGVDAGGKWSAGGAYVVSKEGTNSITLSAAASGANAARQITFYCDTGDEGCLSGAGHTASGYGWMRAFSPSYPVVLHLKKSARRTAPDKTLMQFTVGSPAALAVGTSVSANGFVLGNRRSPSFKAKALMGVVDLVDKAIVYYDSGVCVFKNVRAGGTGDDFDYRLLKLNSRRGTVAWNSICGGDGVAFDMTVAGLRATDGETERILSGDLWNPRTNVGVLGYEVGQGVKASALDLDYSRLSMRVANFALHLSYRLNSGSTFVDRRLVYDYSPGSIASGIGSVLNGDRPYGWSSPFVQNAGMVCAVKGSSGEQYFAADENYTTIVPSTGYGYIHQVDSSSYTTDNGTTISANAYLLCDMCGSLKLKAMKRGRIVYKNESSACAIIFSRRKDVPDSDAASVTLATTSTDDFLRTPVDPPQKSRANGEVVELRFTDDGSGAVSQLFGFELEVDIIEDSFL